MSTSNVSPDEERFLKEALKTGWNILNNHKEARDKLFSYFTKSSREISPDEERELSALANELKEDAKQTSRDLPSGNVSPEDQQRWLTAAIGIASTAYKVYKDNPGAVSKAKSFFSKLF